MQDILPIIILLKSMTKSNLFTPNHIKNIIPTDNIAEITVNNSALSAPNFSKSGYRKAPIAAAATLSVTNSVRTTNSADISSDIFSPSCAE